MSFDMSPEVDTSKKLNLSNAKGNEGVIIFYNSSTGKVCAIREKVESTIKVKDADNFLIVSGCLSDYDSNFIKIENKQIIKIPAYRVVLATSTPAILADGQSQATITIQKYKQTLQEDNTIQEKPENSGTEEITIATTRGKLSALKLNLVDGQGTFTLTSVPETVKAIVTASSFTLGKTNIVIQFTP